MTGIGRVLVVVYAVMALAATGRSLVQIVEDFAAPLAYTLSAASAVVYVLATVALVKRAAPVVPRGLGGDLLRAGRRAHRRNAQPHASRALPPRRDRLVGLWLRLLLGAARAAVRRCVVAACASAHGMPPSLKGLSAVTEGAQLVIVFHEPGGGAGGFGPSVVAIGKFDGVHSGHRAVIDRARVAAEDAGARVVAVTFDRNR
jgi:hypothetical protein